VAVSSLVPLIITCALLGFAVFWCLIMLLISAVGGWRRIARAYPFSPSACGNQLEKYRFGSMAIGFSTRYNGAMGFTIYESGLRIQPGILFRAFHPPIFLDKALLKTARFSGSETFGMLQLELEGKPLMIFGKAAARIHHFAQSKNPYF
jgi:hypothetical protein